ncbi:hypothetical protein CN931_04690 [Bacillus sp. AFS054943]|nr:hypothetical protein CN931_04690 [Bacillus sp. AFS054943]PGX01723.1 hypothetical protein COE07_26435 [Bacillus sp. AFS033286]PGZ67842.1 hypothetical protein COE49_26395 [Bacillus sp. AFS029637]
MLISQVKKTLYKARLKSKVIKCYKKWKQEHNTFPDLLLFHVSSFSITSFISKQGLAFLLNVLSCLYSPSCLIEIDFQFIFIIIIYKLLKKNQYRFIFFDVILYISGFVVKFSKRSYAFEKISGSVIS